MSARFFLQIANFPNTFWEEVDEYTFDNWEYAVLDSGDKIGLARYNGNRIRQEGITVSFTAETTMSVKDFVWIARFLGANSGDFTAAVPGGIVREPEYVQFIKRTQTILKKINGPAYIAKERK